MILLLYIQIVLSNFCFLWKWNHDIFNFYLFFIYLLTTWSFLELSNTFSNYFTFLNLSFRRPYRKLFLICHISFENTIGHFVTSMLAEFLLLAHLNCHISCWLHFSLAWRKMSLLDLTMENMEARKECCISPIIVLSINQIYEN